jgi:hypothetical protein
VLAFYKKGYRSNMANYRPVSLLTSFSKVFERVTYDRLLRHINNNNILGEDQFGFRPKSSMEKASYNLINGILNDFNNKINSGGTFCDLQKAFDSVNHDIFF